MTRENTSKLFRKGFQSILKVLVFLDTWLAFIPLFAITTLIDFVNKPRSNIEIIKRTYTILAISSALIMAIILALLWRIFNVHGIVLFVLMSLYSMFIFNVSWLAYRFDPTIEIGHLGNDDAIEKFTDKLMFIKAWAFYAFIFVLAIIFPRR